MGYVNSRWIGRHVSFPFSYHFIFFFSFLNSLIFRFTFFLLSFYPLSLSLFTPLTPFFRRFFMLRLTFIRKLKAFGHLPIPEGHSRRNKGFTCYFFPITLKTVIFDFIKKACGGDFVEVPKYVVPTFSLRTSDHSIFVHVDEDSFTVCIGRFPA